MSGQWQSDVADFMGKHQIAVADEPTLQVTDPLRHLSERLISEESWELLAAFDVLNDQILFGTPDLAPLAKELADVIYVVLHAANMFGIDMTQVFAVVHASNMTKDGSARSDGKITKGPGYEDPMAMIREILGGE